MPAVTEPFAGRRPTFLPDGLITYGSFINQDVRYLQQRQAIEQSFGNSDGNILSFSPMLTFNGIIEPLFYNQKSFSGENTGKMTMASSVINAAPVINPWISGAVSFVYPTLPLAQNLVEGSTLSDNPNLLVSQAFVNIGNLSQTPFYMTIGQEYLPFGQEFSNMISIAMPTTLGSTKLMTASIGKTTIKDNDFFATAYIFDSKTTLDNRAAGGLNGGYKFSSKHLNVSGDVGASLISSISDAGGFQATGAPTGEFQGFDSNASTEAVAQVPGIDFYTLITVGPYNFISEYVSSLYPFDSTALSYNGNGAQPSALNTEISRSFALFNQKASLAFGYSFSEEALALQLPRQSFTTTLNMSIWPHTLQAIEFQHSLNYKSSDYASGIGSTENTNGTSTSADFVALLVNVSF